MDTKVANYLRIKASLLEAKKELSASQTKELIEIHRSLAKHTIFNEALLYVANEMEMYMEVRV